MKNPLSEANTVEELKEILHPETLLQLDGVDVDDFPESTDADYLNLDKLYSSNCGLEIKKWIYAVGNGKNLSPEYGY